jgi:cytochrome P450
MKLRSHGYHRYNGENVAIVSYRCTCSSRSRARTVIPCTPLGLLPTSRYFIMSLQICAVFLAPLLLIAAVRLHRYSKLSARPAGYPPGPKTAPFLGNLHQVPISRPQLAFTEFARQFGAITGLKLGCQNLVILNTWQAVHDLVEQKGAIYSSRPSSPVADIVILYGENPGLSVYGDAWRAQRKKLVEFLGGERTDNLKPVQDAEATQMIYDMMRKPEDFEHHVDRSFGAAILATVYGQRGKTMHAGSTLDTFARVAAQWAAALGPTASPPLNNFPFLGSVPDWLTPWRGWKKRAANVKREQQRLFRGLLNDTKERLAQGKGNDCFLASCLRTQEKDGSSDSSLSYLAGALLEGGAETSAGSTVIFIMAMAAYPHVLAMAQDEVDLVCGPFRMPSRDDITRLSYVRACVLEVFRWRPIVPLGVPHQTTAADTYGELRIPADTTVIMNTWRINHDDSLYDAPEVLQSLSVHAERARKWARRGSSERPTLDLYFWSGATRLPRSTLRREQYDVALRKTGVCVRHGAYGLSADGQLGRVGGWAGDSTERIERLHRIARGGEKACHRGRMEAGRRIPTSI